MLPAVSAIPKKLVSSVQSGPLLCPHNMINLCQAESADLGGGVEGGGPGNDVPGDGVRDIHIFKFPYMTAQGCFLPL